MLFDGKLDYVDLMVIDYMEKQKKKKERQDKLNYIVRAAKECGESTFNITPLCQNLHITLTADEFNWIVEQVNKD